jgi:hypothetical protein
VALHHLLHEGHARVPRAEQGSELELGRGGAQGRDKKAQQDGGLENVSHGYPRLRFNEPAKAKAMPGAKGLFSAPSFHQFSLSQK